ncbi:ABC transporter substrate-binding protein [uncultured Microbacterium sp.]|jgi:polar amino acid transport system substrate-binding protein|uniref:ABC transporter substrate-binding protein n=1 Tax=uncultured Microbacterium sp. TaxID=191216 RepID=UPI002625ED72|nr:ABC transporter substrate-binding protein [uncultured Microbacterium sp.]
MKRNNRMLIVGAVAASMLMLAGCGGQSLNASPSASGEPAASVANPIPPGDLAADTLKTLKVDDALAERVPASIKADGLKVATADGYPPMEMFDADGKTMVGVDMSLARAMADIWGVKVDIQNSDQNSMIPGVASGRYDVVMSGLNDTAVRREKVSFVDYAKSSGALVVQAGNPKGIKTPADLCGKTLSVLDNGYYMQLGQKFSKECTDAGKPEIKIMGFANDPEALLQLKNGRADAGMNDFPVAAFRAKESGGAYEAIEIPGDALFGIGIAPDNKELISLIQDTLRQMMADGQYAAIFKAWDLSGMTIDDATINQGN